MAIVALQEHAMVVDVEGREEPKESSHLDPGTRVEVKCRFDAKWSRGFEVLEHTADSYRLLRLSDGAALPVLFPESDVRVEKRNKTWWI